MKMRFGVSICFYLAYLLTGGFLTGCRTVTATYHRIEARMAYDAADQETNNYGAFLVEGKSGGVSGSASEDTDRK